LNLILLVDTLRIRDGVDSRVNTELWSKELNSGALRVAPENKIELNKKVPLNSLHYKMIIQNPRKITTKSHGIT
jgi:hypothetical protein